jgi:hypothetical protein
MMVILNSLLRIGNPVTNVWVSVVGLFVLGLGYLGYRLTKGFIGGYLKADIGDNLKAMMIGIHGLGSLILALILPNNYLVDIDFFRELYEQNGLWIAASIVILLFAFLVVFGTLFTLLTRGRVKTYNIEK